MTIEEQLKRYIIEKYGTQTAFANKIGMANSTLNSLFRRGIRSASVTTVIDICSELNISANELAKGIIVPLQANKENDIVSTFQSVYLKAASLTLDGKPLNQAEIDVIFDSITNALTCIRRLR